MTYHAAMGHAMAQASLLENKMPASIRILSINVAHSECRELQAALVAAGLDCEWNAVQGPAELEEAFACQYGLIVVGANLTEREQHLLDAEPTAGGGGAPQIVLLADAPEEDGRAWLAREGRQFLLQEQRDLFVPVALHALAAGRDSACALTTTERDRLQRHNRALRAVCACGDSIVAGLDEHELARAVCEALTEEGDYLFAWICRCNASEDGGTSVRILAHAASHGTEFPPDWPKGEHEEIEIVPPLCAEALDSGHVVVAHPDSENPGAWCAWASSQGCQTSAALPLTLSDHLFGTLCLCAREPGAFDDLEVATLERLTKALRFGMETRLARRDRDRALESLRARVAYEELLLDASTEFMELAPEKRDSLAQSFLELLSRSMQVDHSFVVVFDQPEKLDSLYEWTRPGCRAVFEELHQGLVEGLHWARASFDRLIPLRIGDVQVLPPEAAAERTLCQDLGIRSILVVPVVFRGKLAGFIGMDRQLETEDWAPASVSQCRAVGQVFLGAVKRWQTGQALRESEQRFRALVEASPVASAICRGSKILYANSAAEELIGYSLNALRSMGFLDLVAPQHGSLVMDYERDGHEGAVANARKEIMILPKSGTPHWVDLSACTITLEGEPALLVTAMDINERKLAEEGLRASEERLLRIFQNMPVMVVAYDEDFVVQEWNRECERLTGYSADEIVGNPEYLRLLYPDEGYRDWLAASLKADRGHAFRDKEWTLQCKDGSRKTISWLSISSEFPVSDWAWWTIGVDVTERNRLEREIIEVGRRERQRIGQDLHDGLGQHLTGIAFLSKALAENLSAESPGQAETASKIASLVNEAVSRSRALAKGLQPVSVEEEGLVVAIQDLVASARGFYGVDCRFENEGPVQLPDQSTAGHLYRITQEAITNAVRHGHPDGITVHLIQTRHETRLSIKDDGMGFQTLDARTEGMGLNIMSYRARMIGASLEVQSKPGEGTCVVCVLRHPH